MTEIVKCSVTDYPTLAGIWERSVRATHSFLSEEDITEIREALLPVYFPNVELHAILADKIPVGFIGQNRDKIEMLFIDSTCRGHGYGSALIEFAKVKGATSVDVNEQNASATAFYLQKGFHITGRDETDDCDRPFPILHMSLK